MPIGAVSAFVPTAGPSFQVVLLREHQKALWGPVVIAGSQTKALYSFVSGSVGTWCGDVHKFCCQPWNAKTWPFVR